MVRVVVGQTQVFNNETCHMVFLFYRCWTIRRINTAAFGLFLKFVKTKYLEALSFKYGGGRELSIEVKNRRFKWKPKTLKDIHRTEYVTQQHLIHSAFFINVSISKMLDITKKSLHTST